MRVRKAGERGGPLITIPVPYELEHGPRISECPRSFVTQKAEDLVQLVNLVMGTEEAAGAHFGLSEMPGQLVDAIRMAQREIRAADAAMDDAVSRA